MNQETLREVYTYDPAVGLFRHRASRKGCTEGKVIKGKKLNTGYLSLSVLGKEVLYHRMVYLWHTGDLPEYLDHIDRDKSNPSIENLRECTSAENSRNCRRYDKASGVYLHRASGLWHACIMLERKKYSIGYFQCRDEAMVARKRFKTTLLERIV